MLLFIGGAVLVVGLAALAFSVFEKMKAGQVAGAPLVRTGDAAQRGTQVAASNGAISVQGNVVCQQPLTSLVTRTPCLYYKVSAKVEWRDGDQDRSQTLAELQQCARFGLDDGSGPVWIDATKGGDFDDTTQYSDTKEPGLFGSEVVFGDYRLTTSQFPSGAKFSVSETVLPIPPQLYACGKTAFQSIASSDWSSLILSTSSRDEIVGSATQKAKACLVGGLAALVVGGALAVVGAFQTGLLTRATRGAL